MIENYDPKECCIEYFEFQDGEFICLQQYDDDDPEGEPSEQIVLFRETAIELARTILRELN